MLVDLARIELATSSEVCLVIPNSDFIPPVRAAHPELKTHMRAQENNYHSTKGNDCRLPQPAWTIKLKLRLLVLSLQNHIHVQTLEMMGTISRPKELSSS